MSDPHPSEPDEAGRDKPTGIEELFRPVVEDAGLRPVVLSVFIVMSTVIGWGILLAVRDLQPGAVLGLLGLGFMTIEIIVRGRRERGRIGVAGWFLSVLWAGGIVFAVGGAWSGYL